jgi:hypothetical protein
METKAISTSPRPGYTRVTDDIYVETKLLNAIDQHVHNAVHEDDVDGGRDR